MDGVVSKGACKIASPRVHDSRMAGRRGQPTRRRRMVLGQESTQGSTAAGRTPALRPRRGAWHALTATSRFPRPAWEAQKTCPEPPYSPPRVATTAARAFPPRARWSRCPGFSQGPRPRARLPSSCRLRPGAAVGGRDGYTHARPDDDLMTVEVVGCSENVD